MPGRRALPSENKAKITTLNSGIYTQGRGFATPILSYMKEKVLFYN